MSTGSRRRVAACVALAMLAAGCTGPEEVNREPTPPATEQASAAAPEAGELRVRLEELFGLHAHVVAEASRTSGRAGASAGNTLEHSAEEVVAAVTAAASAEDTAASRLERAWTAYVATVERNEDSAAARRSRSRVARRLARALADVTETLEAQGVRLLLEEPLDTLRRHTAAFEREEYARAYALEREAYADMVTLGGAVAAGIIESDKERYPGPRSAGAMELQSALRQLLGEHALLAATTTRRGITASDDFAAAAAALNGNTADLSGAISSLYDGASSFEASWRDRIRILAEYAAALGDGRRRPAARARRQAERLPERVASVLEQVSAQDVEEGEATRLLRELDLALLAQAEAFSRNRFGAADEAKQEAYGAALALADIIAAAAAEQQPDAFPTQ